MIKIKRKDLWYPIIVGVLFVALAVPVVMYYFKL